MFQNGKLTNRYKIKYKAHSTGYGAHNGATSPDMVLVDLRRMNHIVEIDEKNMVAVIEPYAVGSAIQAECWKRGMNVCITTAGPQSSVLASIAAHLGGSCASVSMGYNGRNMLACEWVAPNGDIIRRFFPKGKSLRKVTQADCDHAAEMNDMPRKLLGYATARELFELELAGLQSSPSYFCSFGLDKLQNMF